MTAKKPITRCRHCDGVIAIVALRQGGHIPIDLPPALVCLSDRFGPRAERRIIPRLGIQVQCREVTPDEALLAPISEIELASLIHLETCPAPRTKDSERKSLEEETWHR